jgi:hypothetical protein
MRTRYTPHLLGSFGLALSALVVPTAAAQEKAGSAATKEISRQELLDRIYGGWAGMLIGGIEGLALEFRFNG